MAFIIKGTPSQNEMDFDLMDLSVLISNFFKKY